MNRPRPIWNTDLFCSLFHLDYVPRHDPLFHSIRLLLQFLERSFQTGADLARTFQIKDLLSRTLSLSEGLRGARSEEDLIPIINEIRNRIRFMKAGDTDLIPCGWNNVSVIITIECGGDNEFIFTMTNTNFDHGAKQFHPSYLSDHPKTKFGTSISWKGVTRKALLNFGTWLCLFMLMLNGHENPSALLYDGIVRRFIGSGNKPEVLYYRTARGLSIKAAMEHLFLSRKLSRSQIKVLFRTIRAKIIDHAMSELKLHSQLLFREERIRLRSASHRIQSAKPLEASDIQKIISKSAFISSKSIANDRIVYRPFTNLDLLERNTNPALIERTQPASSPKSLSELIGIQKISELLSKRCSDPAKMTELLQSYIALCEKLSASGLDRTIAAFVVQMIRYLFNVQILLPMEAISISGNESDHITSLLLRMTSIYASAMTAIGHEVQFYSHLVTIVSILAIMTNLSGHLIHLDIDADGFILSEPVLRERLLKSFSVVNRGSVQNILWSKCHEPIQKDLLPSNSILRDAMLAVCLYLRQEMYCNRSKGFEQLCTLQDLSVAWEVSDDCMRAYLMDSSTIIAEPEIEQNSAVLTHLSLGVYLDWLMINTDSSQVPNILDQVEIQEDLWRYSFHMKSDLQRLLPRLLPTVITIIDASVQKWKSSPPSVPLLRYLSRLIPSLHSFLPNRQKELDAYLSQLSVLTSSLIEKAQDDSNVEDVVSLCAVLVRCRASDPVEILAAVATTMHSTAAISVGDLLDTTAYIVSNAPLSAPIVDKLSDKLEASLDYIAIRSLLENRSAVALIKSQRVKQKLLQNQSQWNKIDQSTDHYRWQGSASINFNIELGLVSMERTKLIRLPDDVRKHSDFKEFHELKDKYWAYLNDDGKMRVIGTSLVIERFDATSHDYVQDYVQQKYDFNSDALNVNVHWVGSNLDRFFAFVIGDCWPSILTGLVEFRLPLQLAANEDQVTVLVKWNRRSSAPVFAELTVNRSTDCIVALESLFSSGPYILRRQIPKMYDISSWLNPISKQMTEPLEIRISRLTNEGKLEFFCSKRILQSAFPQTLTKTYTRWWRTEREPADEIGLVRFVSHHRFDGSSGVIEMLQNRDSKEWMGHVYCRNQKTTQQDPIGGLYSLESWTSVLDVKNPYAERRVYKAKLKIDPESHALTIHDLSSSNRLVNFDDGDKIIIELEHLTNLIGKDDYLIWTTPSTNEGVMAAEIWMPRFHYRFRVDQGRVIDADLNLYMGEPIYNDYGSHLVLQSPNGLERYILLPLGHSHFVHVPIHAVTLSPVISTQIQRAAAINAVLVLHHYQYDSIRHQIELLRENEHIAFLKHTLQQCSCRDCIAISLHLFDDAELYDLYLSVISRVPKKLRLDIQRELVLASQSRSLLARNRRCYLEAYIRRSGAHPIESEFLMFDPAERELQIDISKDVLFEPVALYKRPSEVSLCRSTEALSVVKHAWKPQANKTITFGDFALLYELSYGSIQLDINADGENAGPDIASCLASAMCSKSIRCLIENIDPNMHQSILASISLLQSDIPSENRTEVARQFLSYIPSNDGSSSSKETLMAVSVVTDSVTVHDDMPLQQHEIETVLSEDQLNYAELHNLVHEPMKSILDSVACAKSTLSRKLLMLLNIEAMEKEDKLLGISYENDQGQDDDKNSDSENASCSPELDVSVDGTLMATIEADLSSMLKFDEDMANTCEGNSTFEKLLQIRRCVSMKAIRIAHDAAGILSNMSISEIDRLKQGISALDKLISVLGFKRKSISAAAPNITLYSPLINAEHAMGENFNRNLPSLLEGSSDQLQLPNSFDLIMATTFLCNVFRPTILIVVSWRLYFNRPGLPEGRILRLDQKSFRTGLITICSASQLYLAIAGGMTLPSESQIVVEDVDLVAQEQLPLLSSKSGSNYPILCPSWMSELIRFILQPIVYFDCPYPNVTDELKRCMESIHSSIRVGITRQAILPRSLISGPITILFSEQFYFAELRPLFVEYVLAHVKCWPEVTTTEARSALVSYNQKPVIRNERLQCARKWLDTYIAKCWSLSFGRDYTKSNEGIAVPLVPHSVFADAEITIGLTVIAADKQSYLADVLPVCCCHLPEHYQPEPVNGTPEWIQGLKNVHKIYRQQLELNECIEALDIRKGSDWTSALVGVLAFRKTQPSSNQAVVDVTGILDIAQGAEYLFVNGVPSISYCNASNNLMSIRGRYGVKHLDMEQANVVLINGSLVGLHQIQQSSRVTILADVFLSYNELEPVIYHLKQKNCTVRISLIASHNTFIAISLALVSPKSKTINDFRLSPSQYITFLKSKLAKYIPVRLHGSLPLMKTKAKSRTPESPSIFCKHIPTFMIPQLSPSKHSFQPQIAWLPAYRPLASLSLFSVQEPWPASSLYMSVGLIDTPNISSESIRYIPVLDLIVQSGNLLVAVTLEEALKISRNHQNESWAIRNISGTIIEVSKFFHLQPEDKYISNRLLPLQLIDGRLRCSIKFEDKVCQFLDYAAKLRYIGWNAIPWCQHIRSGLKRKAYVKQLLQWTWQRFRHSKGVESLPVPASCYEAVHNIGDALEWSIPSSDIVEFISVYTPTLFDVMMKDLMALDNEWNEERSNWIKETLAIAKLKSANDEAQRQKELTEKNQLLESAHIKDIEVALDTSIKTTHQARQEMFQSHLAKLRLHWRVWAEDGRSNEPPPVSLTAAAERQPQEHWEGPWRWQGFLLSFGREFERRQRHIDQIQLEFEIEVQDWLESMDAIWLRQDPGPADEPPPYKLWEQQHHTKIMLETEQMSSKVAPIRSPNLRDDHQNHLEAQKTLYSNRRSEIQRRLMQVVGCEEPKSCRDVLTTINISTLSEESIREICKILQDESELEQLERKSLELDAGIAESLDAFQKDMDRVAQTRQRLESFMQTFQLQKRHSTNEDEDIVPIKFNGIDQLTEYNRQALIRQGADHEMTKEDVFGLIQNQYSMISILPHPRAKAYHPSATEETSLKWPFVVPEGPVRKPKRGRFRRKRLKLAE